MATFTLFAWPFIGLLFFKVMGPMRGLIWSFLIGYLFLPEAFEYDLPLLPPYNKSTAIAAACLLGHFFSGHLPGSPLGLPLKIQTKPQIKSTFKTFMIMAALIPVVTIFTNSGAITYGDLRLPSLGIRDYISMIVKQVLLLLPFVIAQTYLYDRAAHREILRTLVLCGLGYSLLVLFEARMSPQLHTWTYGYFQHSWNQHIRGGAFRPIVFLSHGLQVGFFLFAVTIAALALFRCKAEKRKQTFWLISAVWLFGVLFLSRNLGALAITIPMTLVMFVLGPRMQLWATTSAVILILTIPFLRQAEVLPTDRLVAVAERISSERAQSLSYRFSHEDAILERAREKPLAGWGGWARWRIYSATGEDLSTVDGLWISVFAERGWIGYLVFFSFLTFPLYIIGRQRRMRDIGPETIGLMVITAGYLVYIIPNSAGGVFIWLLAGALAGFAQRETVTTADTAEPATVSRNRQYSRFPTKNRA